jgi:hypothetical protein
MSTSAERKPAGQAMRSVSAQHTFTASMAFTVNNPARLSLHA